jgi:hypothetical protein
MIKVGDSVIFTEQAEKDLGSYADDKVHLIGSVDDRIVTFKDEIESQTELSWITKVEESMLKSIGFTTNWNNKLDCDLFTTIRANGNYNVGERVLIKLKGQAQFTVEVILKKDLNIDKIPDYVAYLDTGYDAVETKKTLLKMCGGEKKPLYYYLLKKDNKDIPENKLI